MHTKYVYSLVINYNCVLRSKPFFRNLSEQNYINFNCFAKNWKESEQIFDCVRTVCVDIDTRSYKLKSFKNQDLHFMFKFLSIEISSLLKTLFQYDIFQTGTLKEMHVIQSELIILMIFMCVMFSR